MHILLWVIGVIVLLAVAQTIWNMRVDIKLFFKGQEINAWFKQYRSLPRDQNGNVSRKLLLALPPIPSGWWDDLPRVKNKRAYLKKLAEKQAAEKRRASEIEARRLEYATSVAALKQASSLLESYDELVRLSLQTASADEADVAWVKARLAEVAVALAEKLLAEVRDGNRQSFLTLRDFVSSSEHSAGYWRDTGKAFQAPSNYDHLMVGFLKNPSLRDFRSTRKEFVTGAVRLLAAEARRKQSMFQGKLVLALCNANSDWEREVGPYQLARIAMLVDRLHAQQTSVVARPVTNTTT